MTQIKLDTTGEDLYVQEIRIDVHGEYPKSGSHVKAAQSADSLFYYNYGTNDDDGRECQAFDSRELSNKDSGVYSLVAGLINDNTSNFVLNMNHVPDWHRNRDRTFTLNLRLDNPLSVMEALEDTFHQNTLFLSNDICLYEPTAGIHGKANREGPFFDLYNLIEIMDNQQEIIFNELDENVVKRDAMKFLMDTGATVYPSGLGTQLNEGEAWCAPAEETDRDFTRHAQGHSNWLIKARYLSKVLHRCYPVNFRNIVIHGASKLIAQDKLKLTKLQQFLAACGRCDTIIILVD